MNTHRFVVRCACHMALAAFLSLTGAANARAAELLVEAESFAATGGWMLDTQFIEVMGSPYLLAHGLGLPVKDAETRVRFPAPGEYHVWARTKDWVATWKAPGAPGKFQLSVDGQPLAVTFGTQGADWHWQDGGTVRIAEAGEHALALHDLTGFDGRCDALFFSTDAKANPPQTRDDRRRLLDLPRDTPESEVFDLVVCGGGYAGMGAAISAARQGLHVALLQNRSVLGGNGSSEVQVWAQGGTKRGLFPRLGEIIEEFADHAKNSPGENEEYGDAKKEAIVRAEKNISLFLHNHVIGVEMAAGPAPAIRSVTALDVRTGAERRFRGKFFVDCTGHGTIGALAGANFTMLEKGHLGMSNMWKWQPAEHAPAWPQTPWALPLEAGDFPATKLSSNATQPFYKGEWFWETGFDRHPIKDLEYMRDWNLRAVYGAFSSLKHGKDAAKHVNAQLVWVAAVGGTRESRLLTGDIVLTSEDIVGRREFPDGCVPTTWDLDLHYPKEQYLKKFPDDPFISRAAFGKGVDRKEGYPVPYRCFYSKNVGNLFMAGRCISVNHDALGTIRVMRTCGMMGEVVGKAAYLCVAKQLLPRNVYESYLDDLKDLLRQPGAARRERIETALVLPEGTSPSQPIDSMAKLWAPQLTRPTTGILIDDDAAKLTGNWSNGTNLAHIGEGYRYAGPAAHALARYEFKVPTTGRYEVRLAWQSHANRATNVTCTVAAKDGPKTVTVNQRAEKPASFTSIGSFDFEAGQTAAVTISSDKADGYVHADSVHIVPAP